jgi:hypothetical protein
MCFSATGSFAVSGVLTAIGAASLARNSSKAHRTFAAIPLIFATQQAAEGTVWLTMNGEHPLLHRLAVSVFLGFALIVWPTWLSFSLRLIERNPVRRRALGALFCAGAAVAAYAAVLLVRFRPTAAIAGHSIRYEYAGGGDGTSRLFYLLAYAVPTVVPFFVSTVSLARTIGTMLIVSLVVTVIVERDALTSVWCFFAAILSAVILIAVEREQRLPSFARAARSA